MNKHATRESHLRVIVWLVWLVVVMSGMSMSAAPDFNPTSAPMLGIVSHDASKSGALFPWQAKYRWKKWALERYHKWRDEYRRARRTIQLARLAMSGMLTMAQVVDWLTASQVRYKMGALPVLYALLQTLEVEQIINRHCPTRGDVQHGTVALVLILNRLLLPLPLYRIADWVGETCLVATWGVPASKFNDDRLERTLDALYPHLESIWQEIVAQALVKAKIDLSTIFYDVTAAIAHGRYAESEVIDFGFAHNTPSNKRKFKLGLNASADGGIPWLYRLLSGATADQATVEANLENLSIWLHSQGRLCQDSLIIGDRAMLNSALALAYEAHGLRHLTGLRASTPAQKALLEIWSDAQMEAHPIVEGSSPQYWGRGDQITFTHEGQSVTHKVLVVTAGALRDQWRQSRQADFHALFAQLTELSGRIGQPGLHTTKLVQRSVNARLKASPVGHFVEATVYTTSEAALNLVWQVNQTTLAATERLDGRYLLVTNDWKLSHLEMFRLYRAKDGVEKCFRISKSDLHISPIFLHQDKRIASMLFINMLALLAYTLLQRQIQQHGLQMTTRSLIQRLDQLTLIETHCWDGSRLHRLTPLAPELLAILQLVSLALDEMMQVVVSADHSLALLDSALPSPPQLLC